MDVESSSVDATRQRRAATPSNPYSDGPPPGILPPRHPYNIVKRLSIMGGSSYALHRLDVVHAIFHSPRVGHEWFKLGLAASVAILAFKAYIELYQGKIQNVKVNYENFKQSTHAIMLLILLASISFHVALWPEFGGPLTFLIMILFGFGVLLQFMLLVPTYVQNIVGSVLMTFFIQQYV